MSMKYLLLLLLAIILLTAAQTIHAVVLESGIPGGAGSKGLAADGTDFTGGIVEYIRYLYLFVLGFVAIAGFISLVWWGTVWTASGVIDKKAAAMEGIQNALKGIAIAFGAYILLATINPDLTVIRLKALKPVEINKSTTQQTVAQQIQQTIATQNSEQITGGVAACCFDPGTTAGPGYKWACIGQNELIAGNGCSRVFGTQWQTFGASTQGCLDQIQSIGSVPQC